MTNPHLQQPVVEFGCRIEEAAQVVILVHGRDQDPRFMCDMVVRPLGLAGVAYLAPTAAGNCWYPAGFMAALEENEPWLSYTMECMQELVASLTEQGWPRDKLVLAGFSQGACVVSEYLNRYAQRYKGVAIFTGGLLGPPGSRWPGASLQGTPVLLATSDSDAWIPLGRVEETRLAFEERDACVDLRIYRGMSHTINDEEIACLGNMIKT